MAAPHVSAVAALMLSVNPSLTPAQVRTILQNTADWKPHMNSNEYGHGRLNAYSAVKHALPLQLEDHTFTSFSYPPAVTLTGSAHIFGSSTAESGLTITIPTGKVAVLDGSLSRTGSNHATMVIEGTLIMDEDAVLDGFTIEIGEQGFLLMRDNTAINGQGGSLAG
ncbi:Subtilase family protein [Cyclonatronum proteinivorum]|uniref:Subtilase family protein n=1 Tax=Cyclonatronum proteinivorum TaxID=1457365 RepID=A0A345UNU5_9BACT|nr:Subtilase family protein [Cyclonatronum proteinivorum]